MKQLTDAELLEFLRKTKARHLNLNQLLKEYFGARITKGKREKSKKKNR